MTFITVATVDELEDDVPLAVDVELEDSGDEIGIVIVRHEGKLYALENQCSHANVELSEGDVIGDTIECYLHGAAFDLATGEPLCPPATQPVQVFPVRIVGDDIQVDPDSQADF